MSHDLEFLMKRDVVLIFSNRGELLYERDLNKNVFVRLCLVVIGGYATSKSIAGMGDDFKAPKASRISKKMDVTNFPFKLDGDII